MALQRRCGSGFPSTRLFERVNRRRWVGGVSAQQSACAALFGVREPEQMGEQQQLQVQRDALLNSPHLCGLRKGESKGRSGIPRLFEHVKSRWGTKFGRRTPGTGRYWLVRLPSDAWVCDCEADWWLHVHIGRDGRAPMDLRGRAGGAWGPPLRMCVLGVTGASLHGRLGLPPSHPRRAQVQLGIGTPNPSPIPY
jgi:hypothetical protein